MALALVQCASSAAPRWGKIMYLNTLIAMLIDALKFVFNLCSLEPPQGLGTETSPVSWKRRLHFVCELLRCQCWSVWGDLTNDPLPPAPLPMHCNNTFVLFALGPVGSRWCRVVWWAKPCLYYRRHSIVPCQEVPLQAHGPEWPGRKAERITGRCHHWILLMT